MEKVLSLFSTAKARHGVQMDVQDELDCYGLFDYARLVVVVNFKRAAADGGTTMVYSTIGHELVHFCQFLRAQGKGYSLLGLRELLGEEAYECALRQVCTRYKPSHWAVETEAAMWENWAAAGSTSQELAMSWLLGWINKF